MDELIHSGEVSAWKIVSKTVWLHRKFRNPDGRRAISQSCGGGCAGEDHPAVCIWAWLLLNAVPGSKGVNWDARRRDTKKSDEQFDGGSSTASVRGALKLVHACGIATVARLCCKHTVFNQYMAMAFSTPVNDYYRSRTKGYCRSSTTTADSTRVRDIFSVSEGVLSLYGDIACRAQLAPDAWVPLPVIRAKFGFDEKMRNQSPCR